MLMTMIYSVETCTLSTERERERESEREKLYKPLVRTLVWK
jgi:hypothetical protein